MTLFVLDRDPEHPRPKEESFQAWKERVQPQLRQAFDKLGASLKLQLNDADAFEFLAWSLQTSLNRIIWGLDEAARTEAITMIAMSSADLMDRYMAHLTGQFPPPFAQSGFESPEKFEEFVQAEFPDQGKTTAQKPKAPVEDRGYGNYL